MIERELRAVATEQVVGRVKIDGDRVELSGAAETVFAQIRRRGGEAVLRRVVEGEWSNGYLYLADPGN